VASARVLPGARVPHRADSLLPDGQQVTVLDDFHAFYDRTIKEANIETQREYHARRPVDGLECVLNKTAEVRRLPPQPGDVPQTWANVDKAHSQ
jgi:hypothetical protein